MSWQASVRTKREGSRGGYGGILNHRMRGKGSQCWRILRTDGGNNGARPGGSRGVDLCLVCGLTMCYSQPKPA